MRSTDINWEILNWNFSKFMRDFHRKKLRKDKKYWEEKVKQGFIKKNLK